MARSQTGLIDAWEVATGKPRSFDPNTPALLARHDWMLKPQTTACFSRDRDMVNWLSGGGGTFMAGQSVRRFSTEPPSKYPLDWSIVPLRLLGPGVEVYIQVEAASKKCKGGNLATRHVVFGRSPGVADDWLNQLPPHELCECKTMDVPADLNKRMRKTVRVKTGLVGEGFNKIADVELPGERMVVPVHYSVLEGMVLEPIRGVPLPTPGRILFLGSLGTRHADGTIKRIKAFGFTGELWQLGRIAKPSSSGLQGDVVTVMFPVTPELWVPSVVFTK